MTPHSLRAALLATGALLALGCGNAASTPPVLGDNDATVPMDVATADAGGRDVPVAHPDVRDLDAVLADVVSPDVGSPRDSVAVTDSPVLVDTPAVTDTGTSTDTGTVTGTDGATDAAMDPGPYPPGPYGNTEGAVIADRSWEGYINTAGTAVSTTLPYGPTTLQSLRGMGHRYALLHVSEFY